MVLLLLGRRRSPCQGGTPGLLSAAHPSAIVPLPPPVSVAIPGCQQGAGDGGHWEPPSPMQVVQEAKCAVHGHGHVLGSQTPTGERMGTETARPSCDATPVALGSLCTRQRGGGAGSGCRHWYPGSSTQGSAVSWVRAQAGVGGPAASPGRGGSGGTDPAHGRQLPHPCPGTPHPPFQIKAESDCGECGGIFGGFPVLGERQGHIGLCTAVTPLPSSARLLLM